MIAPRHLRRFEDWLGAAGARLERAHYARPEAGGTVAAVRLVPRDPVARIVVAHGAGNDLLYPLVALFRSLVRSGFEVFSFDLDGHGVESTTTFSEDAIGSALPAAVREAERGRPPLPLHLLGHSLGGSITLHALASGAVEGAQSAVILSSPISISVDFRTALGELRGFFSPLTLSQREHYGLWGLVPAVGPLKRAAYPFRRAEMTGGSFSYIATVQKLLARFDLERAASKISVPTLLVYGRDDLLVPAAQGERLAAAIPASELVLLDGATHWSCAFVEGAVEGAARWLAARTPAGVA